MDNEIMQDDNENVSDIQDILASSDDDDIMKDFNFDDILENSEDSKVEGSDGEETASLTSNADYSAGEENNIWEATNDGGVVAQEDVAVNADTNVWDDISAEQPVEKNEVAMPEVRGDEADNINSWENDDIIASENTGQSAENEKTDVGRSGVLGENGLMSQADDYEDYGDAEQTDFSPLGNLNEPSDIGFLRIYDGGLSDNMYSINKEFESADFNGNENCETIHVNVGHDTYGWNVEFANSVMMSLRDVKEYQKRQGCLPFNSGTIRYGNKVLRFRDIKRIVVYESVRYFSYGA